MTDRTAVTAIFDIGKTHKKFLLFDKEFHVLLEETKAFEEIQDDDNFPCDDLEAILRWTEKCLAAYNDKFDIQRLNFTTYGATLVHLNPAGKVLTPLYNYLKPVDTVTTQAFYDAYGPQDDFSRSTASPALGMLNSGLQLYWLKCTKPIVFEKICKSLHFPNFLAYRYVKRFFADKTSIGCHTALWDFDKDEYHDWTKNEGVIHKLAEVTTGNAVHQAVINDRTVHCGTGLHDSSSALIPYIECLKKPFILLSTGTWNIALNPFAGDAPLTREELKNDTLYFFNHLGRPVKASRLFLGHEHNRQDQTLASHFNRSEQAHHKVAFDPSLLRKFGYGEDGQLYDHLPKGNSLVPIEKLLDAAQFSSYEEAYHYLNLKLAAAQVKAIDQIYAGRDIRQLYVTGGFIQNDIFLKLLAMHYSHLRVKIADLKRASALGAAMVMDPERTKQFSKKHFRFTRIKPFGQQKQTLSGRMTPLKNSTNYK